MREIAAELAVTAQPSSKDEAWQYVDTARLRALADLEVARPENADVPGSLAEGFAWPGRRAWFAAGAFCPALSDLRGTGCAVRTWSELAPGEQARLLALWREASHGDRFALLNLCRAEDRAVLRFAGGPEPLLIALGMAGQKLLSCARLQLDVALGATANAVILPVFLTGGGAGASELSVEVGPGAKLELCLLESGGGEAAHLAGVNIRLRENARIDFHLLSAGAALARLRLRIALEGEGAEARLDGTSLMSGRRNQHVQLEIRHSARACKSRQLFRGVLFDEAVSSFDGTVVVERGAAASEAHQLVNHLLLSDRARAHFKPRLMIHADEVACKHGATAGGLSAEEIFYLRSRGIGEDEARATLVRGFVESNLAEITLPTVREWALHRFFAAPLPVPVVEASV